MQTHQNNHLRIQDLRAATASLDAQIKATLSILALTRKDITSTATTTYPPEGPKYDVSYEELLEYARRISRTTLPPPGATNGIDVVAEPPSAARAVATAADTTTGVTANPASGVDTAGQTPTSTVGVNGAQTPLASQQPTSAPTPAAAPTPSEGVLSQPFGLSQLPSQGSTLGAGSSFTTLPSQLLSSITHPDTAFVPWPSEDGLRTGALSLLQQLADAGIDPQGHDPAEEEERRREAEEAQRREREEAERRALEERARMTREREERAREADLAQWRRGSVVVGGPAGAAAGAPQSGTAGPGEKKQFQFMGDLDDDEDD